VPAKDKPLNKQTDNPNAFKLWINRDSLTRLATEISSVEPDFDQRAFLSIAPQLDPLELKARVKLISEELRRRLPKDEAKAIQCLVKSVERGHLQGFVLWPVTQFIESYGLNHPAQSLEALRKITSHFTGEFAVRPFLAEKPEPTLRFLMSCARSTNVHERRWASEGSRPRLPWGPKLDLFIKAPLSTLPILERLKYDEELYVRKSVANHLNDISKDHPELVVATLKSWLKETPPDHAAKLKWITRHALRTMIKKGDSKALKLIGVKKKTSAKVGPLKLQKSKFKVGEHLEFSFEVRAQSTSTERLVIDYRIHFAKANGATSKKVFKLKNLDLLPGEKKRITKRHHLKKITTRKYYDGTHSLELQVNGVTHRKVDWHLKT